MVSVLRVVSKSDSFDRHWVAGALMVWVKRRCVAISNSVAYCNINFGTGQDDFANPVRLGNRTIVNLGFSRYFGGPSLQMPPLRGNQRIGQTRFYTDAAPTGLKRFLIHTRFSRGIRFGWECTSHLGEYAAKPNLPGPGIFANPAPVGWIERK